MSQSEINAEIDQYLHLVRKKLSMLPDAEAIVSELRTHIWESANKFATRDHLPIEQAFHKALDLMEDPEILANRFYEESGYDYPSSSIPSSTSTSSGSSFSQSFHQRSIVPERSLDHDKFYFIALLGFIASMLIGGILITTIKDPLISLIGTLIQIGAFLGFIGYLYYTDDQNFKIQIAKFREKFEKAHAQHQQEKISRRKLRHQKKWLSPQTQAFFVHLGALLGAIVMFLMLLLLTYVSYINVQPFFNDNWYSIGFIGFATLIGLQMIYYCTKVFLGQVRGMRMFESLINFVSAIVIIFMILYYPFTIGHGILELAGTSITDPNTITILATGKLDYYIRIFMGITVIINIMKGLYGIFKFGTWKEKDTISLLNA